MRFPSPTTIEGMSVKIAWADTSPEQQRRMREIAALFEERAAREELGLSTLRDGLSDALFPGTSTLHTRAKYLLFVPWCYQLASQRNDEADLVPTVRRHERALISSLDSAGDRRGLIGRLAGTQVKNLPSSIYWWMLRRHEILIPPSSPAGRALLAELDDAPAMFFARNLPAPPEGFPHQVPGGFSLAVSEAEWLRERLLTAAPHTTLAHFLHERPSEDSDAPWEDPATASMPQPAREHCVVAEQFSRLMHGAQLLYNLLLAEHRVDLHRSVAAEAAEAQEPEEVEEIDHRDHYRDALERWAEAASDAAGWNLDSLFATVGATRNSSLPTGVVDFVRRWKRQLLADGPDGVADSSEARELVGGRERRLKGAQSRLTNARALAQWGGASGSGRMTMRWSTAQTLLLDIWDGLEGRDRHA